MPKVVKNLIFVAIAIVGTICLGFIAVNRGEPINALWILTAAVSTYIIAYRFYARFIAYRVLSLNAARITPAVRHNDGQDYVPTNKYVVYGHHFAAIAGAGPLAGPVLAAQMGYLPSMIWILAGAVFAGAVQDFVILVLSSRRDGRSLGMMIKQELGDVPGVVALVGLVMIMTILLSALALIVVKALAQSPWGAFTLLCTVPIALVMGVYMRFLRPGKVLEVSIIGFALLMVAVVGGGWVARDATIAPHFTFSATTITWGLIVYGFVASVLPVWLLLAPRDYISTFMKIGTLLVLAVAMVFVGPMMQMPAVTQFVDGTGPVFAGKLFPFLFITIACGAVSGFHALIASGTTPKLVENETHMPFIGYGAMLTESFVAIMALIAASIVDPGVYFAMNSPHAILGPTLDSASQVISGWGFNVTPETLMTWAKDVGETTIVARVGGAPTLAVGMASLFSKAIGGKEMMAFWYHFAILFEALFILTAIDAGTRVGSYMLRDLVAGVVPNINRSNKVLIYACSAAIVSFWGFLVYQGVTDPFGGINTLWPLFGISNQMLAAVALMTATAIIYKMKRERFAAVTMVPTAWLLVTTLVAGWQKAFDPNPALGFWALARKFARASAEGKILAPARTADEMQKVMMNNYLNAALTVFFMAFVVTILIYTVRACVIARQDPKPTVIEIGGVTAAGVAS